MKRMLTAIDRVTEAVLALLMAIMTVVVFAGVFYRYILLQPLGWTEEVGRFCLIWASLLGMYLAYRRFDHIRVDALINRLTMPARARMHIVATLLMAIFMTALTVVGFEYSLAFMGSQSAILEIPLGVVYLALPFSAILMLIAIVAELSAAIMSRGSAAEGQG